MKAPIVSAVLALALFSFVSREAPAQSAPAYDVVIRNGRLLDGDGNLYGTTAEGGSSESCVNYYIPSCGTVFELMPRAGGGWAERPNLRRAYARTSFAARNDKLLIPFDYRYGNTRRGDAAHRSPSICDRMVSQDFV